MKNIFHLFILFFGAVLLFSCDSKRTDEGDLLFGLDGNPNTDTPTITRKLKTIDAHEYDEDLEEWEDSKTTFSYEGSKLVSYKEESSTEPTLIEYNSDGKISRIYDSGQSAVFEYTSGVVTKQTTDIAGIANIVTTFSYSGGTLVKAVSVQTYTFPFETKYNLEANYEYSGTNISKEIMKVGIYDDAGNLEMFDDQQQAFIFTFDDKYSPYKLLPKELLLYLAPCLIGDKARGMFDLPELAALDDKRRLAISDLRMIGSGGNINKAQKLPLHFVPG